MSETTCPKCGSPAEIRDCLVCESVGHTDDGLCPQCAGDGTWIVPHDETDCLRAQLTAALSAKEQAERRVGEAESVVIKAMRALIIFPDEIQAIVDKAEAEGTNEELLDWDRVCHEGYAALEQFMHATLTQPTERGQRP